MATASTMPPHPLPIDGPLQRTVPLHFQPSVNGQGDAMDTSPAMPSMGPPYIHSNSSAPVLGDSLSNGTNTQPSGAAAAAQQPKVVQTAFIHKLYNMLEDQTIQHLITWSSSNDSFLISPSAEFSKVLATYFKHTNVSSFVRQLNMYGFHKVSDVFHSSAPDSPLWEFKHGAGNFRRGDFAGLKEIKRRASRHTLIHRDSFPTTTKPPPLPMGPPPEPSQDTPEQRLSMLEHTVYDLHSRLARSEEANGVLTSRNQMLTNNMMRCLQYQHDISSAILTLMADPEKPLHKDIQNMQQDLCRQLEAMRNQDNYQQAEMRARQPSFAIPQFENGPPMSPFQLAQDDSRRGSLFGPATAPRPGFFRPPLPHRNTAELALARRPDLAITHGATPPREFKQPTLNAIEPPMSPTADGNPNSPPSYLSRRHTSADIRPQSWLSVVGSNEQQALPQQTSPFASGQSSSNWPSSPHRASNVNTGEQQLRDSLARYQLSTSDGRPQPPPGPGTPRNSTPPQPQLNGDPTQNGTPSHHHQNSGHILNHSYPASTNPVQPPDGPAWGFPGGRLPFKDVFASGPPTRRGSVAHLLNPADTAERDEEEELGPEELRKRKRLV